jgi:hypothetical protein
MKILQGSVFATYASKDDCQKLIAAVELRMPGATEPLIKMTQCVENL